MASVVLSDEYVVFISGCGEVEMAYTVQLYNNWLIDYCPTGSICSNSHYIVSLLDQSNAGSLTFEVPGTKL